MARVELKSQRIPAGLRSFVRALVWATGALGVALAIHVLASALLRDGSVYSPNERPAAFSWPDTAIQFAYRALLSVVVGLWIGWVAAVKLHDHSLVHASVVASEYAFVSVLLLEETTRVLVTRIGPDTEAILRVPGDVTLTAILFDALVLATVPLSWMAARALSARRVRPA